MHLVSPFCILAAAAAEQEMKWRKNYFLSIIQRLEKRR